MSEPKYVKIYYHSAERLMSLTTNQWSLLTCLLSRYENTDGVCSVIVDREEKARICSLLEWNDATLANALRGLKKAQIIIKTGKESYRLNANIFGVMGGKHK